MRRILKKISVILAVAVVAAAGAGVAGHDWWERNRMSLPCLLLGVWGNGGPGMERHLDYWDGHPPAPDDQGRELILVRHWPQGQATCAPADRDEHWAFVKKIAAERNWAEAHFLLAVKLGYGDVYGETLFDSGDSEILRSDLGDGTNLDLEQSFALLQKSAEQGYFRAQSVLNHALKNGAWGKGGALKIGALN